MKKLAACFVCLLLAITCEAKIIYIDDDANGLNDGSSWANACNYLQDALADANSAEKPVEIRVAEGIYKPDQGAHQTPGSPTATFQLINGVTIKGGYAGFGEPNPNARDIALYKAILSGDIGTLSDKSDNCYHIFYHPEGLNLDNTAILDGFTITGGNANGSWPYNCGGGMHNYNSSPTVTNCTFSANSANYGGGGMFNRRSNPTLLDCTFTGNSLSYPAGRGSSRGGGMYNSESNPMVANCTFGGNSAQDSGGGMYNDDNSSPTVEGCTFIDNSSSYRGGGMCNWDYSRPTVKGCTFTGNSVANGSGGGMCNSISSPIVDGCTFTANSAKYYGGGMHNYYYSSPTVTNCTIAYNSALNGPAVACDSPEQKYPSTVTMVNCIVWNGSDWLWNNDRSTITITYSDVQSGWTGTGNINADPCFASSGYWDPNGTPADANDDFWVDGDYHLKSQAGRWDPLIAGWIKDNVTSPCIDAGDPASPIGYEPFPNGGIINMGVYGGTAEASKSYFGEPVCETIVAGDINGDCKVNLLDFALIALHWLEDNTPQPPGQASNPWPPDGAMSDDLEINLSWTAGTNALSHDVYFGTDANALASADKMAPEYRGNRTFTMFYPGLLTRYTTYYWRIDEIGSGGITKGIVWRFTTGAPGPKGMTCFPADTPVWVDGTLVEISKVVAGQMVGKTNCLAASSEQIEAVQEHEGTFECLDITLENGNTISVVDSHCFLLDSGQWAPVQKLTTGSKLKSLEGLITVRSIVKREKPFVGKVYNLKIKDTDWYLVGRDGLIVRDY